MIVDMLVEAGSQSLLSLGCWITQQFCSGDETLEDSHCLQSMSETQRECVSALAMVSGSSCSFYRRDAVG